MSRLLAGAREQPLSEEPGSKQQKRVRIASDMTTSNAQFIADGQSNDEAHHAPALPCNNTYQHTSASSLLLTAGNDWWKSGDA